MDVDPSQLISAVWSGMRMLPWHWVALAAHVVLAPLAAMHAMLYKRDPRAALGWVAMCLFFPLLGPLLYYLFGINRIQTHARKLAHRPMFRLHVGYERGTHDAARLLTSPGAGQLFSRFVQISDRVTTRPLTAGNMVEMLQNGEQAYPSMLAAINGAVHRGLLVVYALSVIELVVSRARPDSLRAGPLAGVGRGDAQRLADGRYGPRAALATWHHNASTMHRWSKTWI